MNIGSTFRQLPPVTKNILIINLLIWVALQLFPASTKESFINICALHYPLSENFNLAQIFTYMFVQEEFFHLFFNMFALFMFGNIIERTIGTRRFLFYYISCGIGAALIQLGVFAFMLHNAVGNLPAGITIKDILALNIPAGMAHPDVFIVWNLINTPVIGASGAIFGILLAFGYMFPKAPLYLFFIPVPIQARWVVLGYGAIELLQSFNNNPGDNVAHMAHLGGRIIGFLILLDWKKKGLFYHGGNF